MYQHEPENKVMPALHTRQSTSSSPRKISLLIFKIAFSWLSEEPGIHSLFIAYFLCPFSERMKTYTIHKYHI